MRQFTTETKQRILNWHKARVRRKVIKRIFKITDKQLDNLLQKERLKKEKLKTNDLNYHNYLNHPMTKNQ